MKTASLPEVIQRYKSLTGHRFRRQHPNVSLWQSSFHDRILRNDRELDRARTYINENPQRWSLRHPHQSHPPW